MNSQQLAGICLCFRLGAPVAAPKPVPGGRVHQIWRIETTEGIFAVKLLRLATTPQPGALASYRRAEGIAQAMAALGVPAVAGLAHRSRLVQRIQGVYVVVFPWAEGVTLPFSAASPEQARQIGALLGKMHAFNLAIPGLDIPTWKVLRDDDWVLLARRAAAHAPWAEDIRASVRALCWWSRLARDANPRLWNTLVVSHCDVCQSNVIWRDAHTPALIDWESAGLINPSLELVKAALDWSGISVGEPEEASFKALLAGYRGAGGPMPASAHDALAGTLGHWLAWLEFNMQRSLGTTAPPEEQALGVNETTRALATLQRIGENLGA